MIGYDKPTKTYYVQIRNVDPITGKVRFHKKRGFSKKQEASKYERNYFSQKEEAKRNATTDTSILFSELAEQYWLYIQATKKAHATAKKQLEHHFPYFNMHIASITKEMLLNWNIEFINKDFSTSMKNSVIHKVKAIYRYGEEAFDMKNPSLMVRTAKKTREEKQREMQIWTVEEFNKMDACVENPVAAKFFEFLFWTGCRRGEAIALQKSDLKGNRVTINKSMRYYSGGFTPTKTTNSVRTIDITPQLVEDLQPLFKTKGDFLFGGERPLALTPLQRQFTNAIAESGVKHARIHDLRHSHASMLIANNVPITAIAKRLGHSSPTITLRTYSHLFQKTEQEMMDTLASLQGKGEKTSVKEKHRKKYTHSSVYQEETNV